MVVRLKTSDRQPECVRNVCLGLYVLGFCIFVQIIQHINQKLFMIANVMMVDDHRRYRPNTIISVCFVCVRYIFH